MGREEKLTSPFVASDVDPTVAATRGPIAAVHAAGFAGRRADGRELIQQFTVSCASSRRAPLSRSASRRADRPVEGLRHQVAHHNMEYSRSVVSDVDLWACTWPGTAGWRRVGSLSDRLIHAIAHDHFHGDLGRPLQIIRSACRHLTVEDYSFCGARPPSVRRCGFRAPGAPAESDPRSAAASYSRARRRRAE